VHRAFRYSHLHSQSSFPLAHSNQLAKPGIQSISSAEIFYCLVFDFLETHPSHSA